jgi:hypothetical protein
VTTGLHWGALASIAWASLALAESVRRAWRRGTTASPAAPAGSAWSGVAYAFGSGMSPRVKESAAQHPWIYAAGLLYHVGVAAAFVALALALSSISAPPAIAGALACLLFVAAAAGGALLVRRHTTPLLRAISALDDYASNLLVDSWLVTAGLSLLSRSTTPALLVATTILGLYVPFGKIRHCVFFFLARLQFGLRIGRRGLVGSSRPRGRV